MRLRDLRAAPPDLSVPTGERPDVRVVHTVGSDCAIGKMSVTLELDAAARARGLESAFVATGQTGIAITGWGIAVDHVISDFVAGAAARLVEEGAARAPLLFLEGQGALGHPAYSGVTLGPAARRPAGRDGALPPRGRDRDRRLPRARRSRRCASSSRPTSAPPAGCARRGWRRSRSTRAGSTTTPRRAAIAAAAEETGLPADDPVRFGGETLLAAVV